MTDSEFKACIARLRSVAEPVGPCHGYWDVIFYAEDVLAGRPCDYSREQMEVYVTELLP